MRAVLLCLLALAAASLDAQSLSGVVRDSARAVVGARVTLLPSGTETRSDSAGRFAFALASPGDNKLLVTQVGYRPDTSDVLLSSGRDLRVEIQLRPLPQLETVVVRGYRDRLPRVAERESRGLGAVMYAEEIERRNPFDVIDLIRGAPELGVVAGVGPRRDRGPLMFVDGVLRRTFDPLLTPRPDEIAAIEVHRGFAGMRDADVWMPPSLNYSTSRRIIFIWTKQYVELDERRREVFERERQSRAQRDSTPP